MRSAPGWRCCKGRETGADFDVSAAHQFRPRHGRFARSLRLASTDRAVAAGDRQFIVEHLAGWPVRFDCLYAEELDAFNRAADPDFGIGAGRGRQSVDVIANASRIGRPGVNDCEA